MTYGICKNKANKCSYIVNMSLTSSPIGSNSEMSSVRAGSEGRLIAVGSMGLGKRFGLSSELCELFIECEGLGCCTESDTEKKE